ncbi:2-oxoglutarate synthase [Pararhodospirillum oryzae]|uniref:2-oxoglutarate synthase n=2 Tax=Pararhodospirillum oryzae TaxID=478448 RepID=A0A512H4I7_9PROT|nr:2-oxoglutarate synthase [Pararhodospirillum oryzae]
MTMASVSIALTGSGGAGVMTAGRILMDAAAEAGLYGLMTRSLGPQIRGGESAALVRLGTRPVDGLDDICDLLVAVDWGNIERFAAEIPLAPSSLVVADPAQGPVPEVIAASGARVVMVPFRDLAAAIPDGRVNMVALGLVASLIGLPDATVPSVLSKTLKRKGEAALTAGLQAVTVGEEAVATIDDTPTLDLSQAPTGREKWSISGNDATAFGVLRGGVRFVAAYPITPATEILEWLAVALPKVGGCLVQAEDELASINMILGASFGGVPSMTATSGPGLALMTEALGLGVAAEVPIVVCNVMRGGPSTGIPTKSEQADLNMAVYGLHGDAPHIVTAATSIADCLFTAQWSVYLAEAMQVPVIMLTDQAMGQARAVIDRPADVAFVGRRETVSAQGAMAYQRYAVTASGVSPMAIPGTPECAYTADGLEHSPRGTPSTQAAHHQEQLDKRLRKITGFDYGAHWAVIDGAGEGDTAIITWGSLTGAAMDAAHRLRADGIAVRVISVRLLSPLRPEVVAEALAGVSRVLVVEQSHGMQFSRLLRAHLDLPGSVRVCARPGPVPIRPHEIVAAVTAWDKGE